MRSLLVTFLSIAALLPACGSQPMTTPPFNGEQSMAFLTAQVELGPRVPGSAASLACRELYKALFDSLGFTVDSQRFDFHDPYSNTTLQLTNFIAHIPGSGATDDRIVLMAHYDSRPRSDYAKDTLTRKLPIAGANDGASGCAVLMELARAFKVQLPAGPVDLVFVDGEDWGKAGDHDLYMLGSTEFARRGIRGKYRFGLVLDMIGDKDQQIYRERHSERFAKKINDMVWDAAQRLGVSTFIDTVKYEILDDHLSLNIGGVPAIDIIDFDYPYWHTEFDTVDKCSAEALENVGRVVLEVLYNRDIWPTKK